MSLVNDMLRDLDRRRKSPEGISSAADLIPASSESESSGGFKAMVATLILGILVVGGLVAAYLLVYNTGPTPISLNESFSSESGTSPSGNSSSSNISPSNNQQSTARVESTTSTSRTDQSERQSPAVAVNATVEGTRSSETRSEQTGTQNTGAISEEILSSSTLNNRVSSAVDDDRKPLDELKDEASIPGNDSLYTDPSSNEVARITNEPKSDDDILIDSLVVPLETSTDTSATDWFQDEPQISEARERVEEAKVEESNTIESIKNTVVFSFAEKDRLNAQEAVELWSGNQAGNAISVLESYIRENPAAHESRELLAQFYLRQGKQNRLLEIVDQGLKISPNRAGYKKVKARSLISMNRFKEAAGLLAWSAPQVSTDIEYYEMLANAYYLDGEFLSAIGVFNQLIQHDSSKAAWWFNLGTSYDQIAEFDQAERAYSRALGLPDLNPSLRNYSEQRKLALQQ